MVDFQTWLKDRQAQRCLLIELESSDGVSTLTHYLATTKSYATAPTDTPPNQPYDDVIADLPTMRRSLYSEFDYGEIVVDGANDEFVSWLNRGFDGRPVRIYLGDPSWPKADFTLIHNGICAGVRRKNQSKWIVKIRDRSYLLDVPLETNRFAAGANQGRVYPTPIGQVRNAEAILIDAANYIYALSGEPIQAMDAVRENGNNIGAYTLSLNTSPATMTLTAAPRGTITWDGKGVKLDGVWVQTTAKAIEWAWRQRAAIAPADIDAASLAAFNAVQSSLIGIYVTDERTVGETVDEIARSANAFTFNKRSGAFAIALDGVPEVTAALTLDADEVATLRAEIVRREEPVKSWAIGYKRRWLVQKNLPDNAMPQLLRAEVSQKSDITRFTNPGASAKYLLAKDAPVQETLFYLKANADAEAQRMAVLRTNARETISYDCFLSPYGVDVGATIQLHTGQMVRLVGISERALGSFSTIEVMP